MPKKTDVFPVEAAVYFLPVQARIPLKFGAETVTGVTCARVRVRVRNGNGKTADGWGETPLSASWVWPGSLSYQERDEALQKFTIELARAWLDIEERGHPIEIGHDFMAVDLPALLQRFNGGSEPGAQMPWLAALVCCSPFDIAVHDAFARLNGAPVYETYNRSFMNRDLGAFLMPASNSRACFNGKYPEDFFASSVPQRLPAWHLVGGKDAVTPAELTGSEPQDGYPVLLSDWIARDGLRCLKVKLAGNDAESDYARLVSVGRVAAGQGVLWLSADFNCTVQEPEYVNEILDRLLREEPRIYGMLLYIEQPFAYELEDNQIDVRSVAARKPLFMDESAHDWQLIRLGRELGWSGVALKTCKTQTGALLSLCWARAHGMTLMVQDLSNPMLAQIPHLLLAAHTGTIMGVETNGMQFYPEASLPEAEVHPGLYRRRNGEVDLGTVHGSGFGYRLDEIRRTLPEPAIECR